MAGILMPSAGCLNADVQWTTTAAATAAVNGTAVNHATTAALESDFAAANELRGGRQWWPLHSMGALRNPWGRKASRVMHNNDGSARGGLACAAGCEEHGNCNRDIGRCECAFSSCRLSTPTAPASEAARRGPPFTRVQASKAEVLPAAHFPRLHYYCLSVRCPFGRTGAACGVLDIISFVECTSLFT